MHASHDPHELGLSELLCLYSTDRLHTSIGQDLLRTILSKRQLARLASDSSSESESKHDLKLPTGQPARDSLSRCLYKAARCCFEASILLKSPRQSYTKMNVLESIDSVYSAYIQMLDWEETVPSGWRYTSHIFHKDAEQINGLQGYPQTYFIFNNAHYCGMWITVWCAHIHLLQALEDLLSLTVSTEPPRSLSDLGWDLHERLSTLADSICASVPYMMNDINYDGRPGIAASGKAIGAFFLLRGLYVAKQIRALSTAQQAYISETLLHIAHVKGIKAALLIRDAAVPAPDAPSACVEN